jgi:hypothetical protein
MESSGDLNGNGIIPLPFLGNAPGQLTGCEDDVFCLYLRSFIKKIFVETYVDTQTVWQFW